MSVLKRGSSGESVKVLQDSLVKLGYQLTVDGKFGEHTEQAVLHIQHAYGYTKDGIVGEHTAKLISDNVQSNWNMATSGFPFPAPK